MPKLLFEVHFLDGRYHGQDSDGRPEWPPSPARLFQAFVAGMAQGALLLNEDRETLAWLEELEHPVIAAPAMNSGQSFKHFMPNNDLDTVGGNPARIAEIRSATKWYRPRIFDEETPLLYVWSFDSGHEHAARMLRIAEKLYQVGRGVDMAWAVAEVIESSEADMRLAAYPGVVYRPTEHGAGSSLACPCKGSLKSLIDRYEKTRSRFKTLRIDVSPKKQTNLQTFSQPPKPYFDSVCYNCPPTRLLFELHDTTKKNAFSPWPIRETARLVENIRNAAAKKLYEALPEKGELVKRVFGLCRDATEADKVSRIRLIPLPSTGHQHADHAIRRILLEIPAKCPLVAGDIAWAIASVEGVDQETGEIQWLLVAADDNGMFDHYGIGGNGNGFRIWRTVTPMALPVIQPHGRMKGTERVDTEFMAATAVAQALRHAGTTSKLVSIRLQREPFDIRGISADEFAAGTRFRTDCLWHVEITFEKPMSGILIAGNGRYLGLGLLQPLRRIEGIHAFEIVSGLASNAAQQLVVRSLRRAVIALVQEQLGRDKRIPTFFSGHEEDGSPARRGGRSHLAFVFDGVRQRLLVLAPHLLENRPPTRHECGHIGVLSAALANFRELRAGVAGMLKLKSAAVDEENDPLFMRSAVWNSQTDYRPTRHGKKISAEQAVIADVHSELVRRGVPLPKNIRLVQVSHGPKGGTQANMQLIFSTAIKGPLLLGRTCNLGGGLFTAQSHPGIPASAERC